ncbi:MAG: hypothetical protein AABW63_02210 [Nanoarchaeota archaeon]
MQKGFKIRGEFLLITVLFLVLAIGFVIAEGNSTNSTDTGSNNTNSTNNETNQTGNNQTNNETNQSITCTNDDSCADGYECKDNKCILEDKEDNKNETDDKNETEDDDENETSDNFDKVCCKFYMKQQRGNEIEEKTKYLWIDRTSCITEEGERDKIFTKDIMNDSSLCRGKLEVRERQRLKFEDRTNQTCPTNCTCMGVVMKCPLEGGGSQMTIFAGKSGNIIIQIKGENMTTNVTIYNDNGTLIGEFGNGEIKEIKITPDQLKVKFREKEKIELEDEEIELKDNGFYEYKGKKNARLLAVIPVKEHVTSEIDPETGEVKVVKTSWWGFLARDKKD